MIVAVEKEKTLLDSDDTIDIIEHDLTKARELHDDQMDIIYDWMKEYNGEPYGNEQKGRSSIVWKLIKKHGESLIANIVKPFIGNFEIVNMDPMTEADTYKTKINEKLINHFWNKESDPNRFLKTLGRVQVEEGTVFVRVGWEYEYKEKKETIPLEALTDQMKEHFGAKGAEFIENTDGTVTIVVRQVIKNRPTRKVVPNEDIFIDPTAESIEQSEFLIHRIITNLAEISRDPMYDEKSIKKLKKIIWENDDERTNYGIDLHNYNEFDFEFGDEARKKITLFEYWGNYDIDGKGKTEPVVMTMAEYGDDKDRLVIRMEKNPYPFKRIPFIEFQLYHDPFKIYGRALADMISDEQKMTTSIIRGVIDNMASSNNNIKFFKKGSIDATNFNRLKKGDKFIEVNTTDSINTAMMDGSYNQIPPYVIGLISMFDQEAEAQDGISKIMQGIPGSEVKASSTNFSTMMSQSQIRLLDITTNITNGLRKMFMMWGAMCAEYIGPPEIKRITGIDIPALMQQETQRLAQQFQIQQLPPDTAQKAMIMIAGEVEDMFNRKDIKYDIKIKVGTDGLKQIKIQNILMLMQQVGGLTESGSVPPEAIKLLVADLSEQLDRPDIAQMIVQYQPPGPSPEQQQMQQLQMAQMEANVQKDKALAANAMARTQNVAAKTKVDMAGADATIANKYADVNKKMADVDQKDTELGIRAHEAGTKRGDSYAKAINQKNSNANKGGK